MKNVNLWFNNSILLAFIVLLSACVGTSEPPVIYVSPVSGGTYTLNESNPFRPIINFPEGIPDDVSVLLNGVEIVNDFDDWGVTTENTIQVTKNIDSLNTPKIMSALRAGNNTFQVANPFKASINFTIELQIIDVEVHVLNVSHGYDGLDNPVTGIPIRMNEPLVANGYLTKVENLKMMKVTVHEVNSDGSLTDVFSMETPVGARFDCSDPNVECSEFVGSDYYLELNEDNTFSFAIYDGMIEGAISIDVTNDKGGARTTWLRSYTPLYDSKVANNGAMSFKFSNITLNSVLQYFAKTLTDVEIVENSTEPFLEILGLNVFINKYIFSNFETEDTFMPVPGQRGESISIAKAGQINTEIKVNQVKVFTTQSCPISTFVCRAILLGVGQQWIMTMDVVDYPSETVLTIENGLVKANTNVRGSDVSVSNFTLDAIGESLDKVLLEQAVNFIANNFDRIMERILILVANKLIEDFFNEELANLNINILGRQLDISPQVNHLTTSVHSWIDSNLADREDVTFEMNIGLDFKGVASDKQKYSLGSIYMHTILTNAVTDPNSITGNNLPGGEDNKTTGLAISENGINRVLMGLWESGLLSFNENLGEIPQNPLIDDVKVDIDSAAPWVAELLPEGSSGHVSITINDFLLSFQGDYFDYYTWTLYDDYNFLNMTADIYAEVVIKLEGEQLVVTLISIPSYTITDYSSSLIPISATQANQIFEMFINSLYQNQNSFSMPFPFAGLTWNFGEFLVDNNQAFITMDAYSKELYPAGPPF